MIKAKYNKLNHKVLPKLAVDKQVGIGCKGKDKYWFGCKGHVGVGMKNGFIKKVAITLANTADANKA